MKNFVYTVKNSWLWAHFALASSIRKFSSQLICLCQTINLSLQSSISFQIPPWRKIKSAVWTKATDSAGLRESWQLFKRLSDAKGSIYRRHLLPCPQEDIAEGQSVLAILMTSVSPRRSCWNRKFKASFFFWKTQHAYFLSLIKFQQIMKTQRVSTYYIPVSSTTSSGLWKLSFISEFSTRLWSTTWFENTSWIQKKTNWSNI